MNTPNGFRTESIRTPNASRVGALHATQRYSTPSPSHPCLSGNWDPTSQPCRTRRMDALDKRAGVRS